MFKTMHAGAIKVLAFDVFGTVVDWRSSIAKEASFFAQLLGVQGDWYAFADAWRAEYAPSMDKVRVGKLPWMRIDALHRMNLDAILDNFNLSELTEAQREDLNKAWHRLSPWADSVEGLNRLKKHYTITTLSNGNVSLLTAMAKNAGLPWDCVLSAELFQHYKPDRQAYQGVADLLDVAMEQLMLVACHPSDLRAAKTLGCKTAYVIRPLEFGPNHALPKVTEGEFDFVVNDFCDLASQLRSS